MSATVEVPSSVPASLPAQFGLAGDFVSAEPYGSGHINQTYALTMNQGGTLVRYLVQRINERVFRDPPQLMENIRRVTMHVRAALEAKEYHDVSRRVLTLRHAADGRPFWQDEAGGFWRCYLFIEKARTHDLITNLEQARAAAAAIGAFQRQLSTLDAATLHETIPGFHDTPTRLAALQGAAATDPHGRLGGCHREMEFCLERLDLIQSVTPRLGTADIPLRVTHNDTKLNNVMLDDATGEGICVIDLDTVMPGSVLFDFGDMCRTGCNAALEDERDLRQVHARMEYFSALLSGYLSEAAGFLTPVERSLLPLSARLITLEIGMRFLTDHLLGDTYFKIHRPGHNLDRARVQLRLVESFERQAAAMGGLLQELSTPTPGP